MFWIASGVNVAGLLILGWRYWPFILLDILPFHFFVGAPLPFALIGIVGNVIEALLSWWLLHALGRYEGRFDRTRTVSALLLAALIAPTPDALAGTACMVHAGQIRPGDYWSTMSHWNFGNGTAILLLAPLLTSVRRRFWHETKAWELAAWLATGLVLGIVAFDGVFRGSDTNFVFLIFPFVIFAGVRLGPDGAAAALCVVLLCIYVSLIRSVPFMATEGIPAKVWFLQAFCWVLASTGLMVAALVRERSAAEKLTREEQARTLEASLREERARLDALRYQINPHFLFNALNSVCAAIPSDAKVPRDMVLELAGYLRSTLDRPDGDFLSLGDEIGSVEHYLAIEKKRFGDDLQVSISVEPEAREKAVPVFLLQPLVENAIRHGFALSRDKFELHIRATLSGSRLFIEVANSGLWKESGNRPGHGLENIQRRLALLYGPEFRFERIAEKGWVRFRIELPSPHIPAP